MHTVMRRLALAFLALTAGAASVAAAQPPRVFRDRVEPQWLEGGSRFWYRADLPDGGREFVLVDAEQRTREPAFDHASVARWLSDSTGQPCAPERLPFRTLEWSADATEVTLSGGGRRIRFNRTDGRIEALEDSAGSEPAVLFLPPRPSTNGGDETSLSLVNRLGSAVRLTWIDPQGERHGYGAIEPGATHSQHTYAGHVFLIEGDALPDGACVAGENAPLTVVLDENSVRNIERRGRGEGRRGRRNARRTGPGAATSPDGLWTAHERDADLWLRQAESGEETRLTSDATAEKTFRRDTSRARLMSMAFDLPDAPAGEVSVLWSPDSRFLLAWQTEQVPERLVQYIESSPDGEVQPALRSYPYLKAGDPVPVSRPRLFGLDPPREIAVDGALFPNPWELGFLRWSDDGARCYLHYNERGHQTIRLLELELATGKVRAVVEETSPTFIHYSDPGKSELHWLPEGRLLWASERSGWNHLYRYDIGTGACLNAVTTGDWNVRRVEMVDAAAGVVWFQAVGIVAGQDPYHEHFCRVDLDGSNLKVLTTGDGTHSITWSPDRRFFIDRWSRVDLPPVHELRSAEGELLVTLETADLAAFEAAGGRTPTRFVAKGRDGTTDIWGILHWPAEMAPGKRYPVLEQIYAGPHDHHVPKQFLARHGAQRMADEGFIVVQIDGMGTAWRSKAFHDVCWRNLKDAGFPDRIAWMNAAAKEFPELDIERVGVYGGSAGGQNAMAAVLWHSDFYKAAAADCGCHDNRMDKIWWSEQWMGWPVGEHYAENSNAVNAHRLGGALMLTVGELDRNVDPATTTQVVGQLIKADKDFEFLLVVGGGHGSGDSPWAARKRLEFFRRHLGSPEPATAQVP